MTIANLLRVKEPSDESITVNGWVRSIRKQKSICFAAITDGSSMETMQAALTPTQAESLSNGTAVRLVGTWKPLPNPKIQSHELCVAEMDILGASRAEDYPLQKKYQTPEFLRTMPHIRSRTPFNSTMLRFRSETIAQISQFFSNREFTQTHPPIITSSDCEGAGEVFSLASGGDRDEPLSDEDDGSFFRSKKFLTVSNQLHLEALAQSVGNVWTLSPTFRAEKSETARHLSEFYMLEAEMPFIDEMSGLMDLIEDMLRNLTVNLYDSQVGQELIHGARSSSAGLAKNEAVTETLERRWKGMITAGAWPRITYTTAVELLQKSGQSFDHKPEWGIGLQSEHERYIASTVGQGKPVFVTQYPTGIKPFYMLPTSQCDPAHPTVECFDLLVPDLCEIVGGSMREHRATKLIQAMRERKMLKDGVDLDDQLGTLKWYVDLRRWGSVPHGGFGLGFDRLLAYLAGVQNIREVVTFPRWVGRCEC